MSLTLKDTGIPYKRQSSIHPSLSISLKVALFARYVQLLHRIPRVPRNSVAKPTLLIFKPDGIGDLILASGAIRWLASWARVTHGWECTLIVAHFAENFAKKEFSDCDVRAIYYCEDRFRGGYLQTLRQGREIFRELNVKLLVSLRHQLSLLQDLLLCWVSADRSFATRNCPIANVQPLKFKASDQVDYPAVREGSGFPYEIQAHAAICSAIGGMSVNAADIAPNLRNFAVDESRNIVIFPYASDNIRQYPISQLVEAITTSQRKDQLHRILICGPRSITQRLHAFRDMINYSGNVEVVPTSNFSDAVELIASALMVIGMDSAPAHAAIALNKPGVFFLGGGHFGYFAPWGLTNKHIWLTHQLPCYMCQWHCPFDQSLCLAHIPPAQVAEAIGRLLQNFDIK